MEANSKNLCDFISITSKRSSVQKRLNVEPLGGSAAAARGYTRDDVVVSSKGDVGQAIRSGDEAKLREYSVDQIRVARFAFVISVDKTCTVSDDDIQEQDGEDADETTAEVTKLLDYDTKATVEVTSLELAVLSRQPNIVRLILEKTWERSGAKGVQEVIGEKTRVQFQGSIGQYSYVDQALEGINAFHLAASYDPACLEEMIKFTMKYSEELLDLVVGLAGSQDNYLGNAPLHLAARNKDENSVRHLLEFDVEVDPRDNRGYTPLHEASKSGLHEQCRMLLECGADPKAMGKSESETSGQDYQRSPLHRAGSAKIVRLLLEHGADPYANATRPGISGTGRHAQLTTFDVLLGRSAHLVTALLDEQIGSNGQSLVDSSSELLITFDLGLVHHECRGRDAEMILPARLVYFHQRDILKHPLIQTFLQMKWNMARKFFYLNIIIFGLFTAALTALALVSTNIVKTCGGNKTVIMDCLGKDNNGGVWSHDFYWFWSFQLVSCIFTTIILGRELLQGIFAGRSYCFRERENWLEITLLFLTFAFYFALHFDLTLSRHFAAFAVFLAWTDLTLLLGRFPSVGIYIYMSVHVIKLLLAFFLVYSTTIVAFALSFHLLLPENPVFANAGSSVLKVLTMMLGEFDYASNFDPEAVQAGQGSVQVMFVIFFFIVSIILVNLIIGLTVSKTQELFEEAESIRLEKTTLQIMGVHHIVRSMFKCSCLPEEWTEKLLKYIHLFPSLKTQDYKVCVQPMRDISSRKYDPNLDMTFEIPDHSVFLFDAVRQRKGAMLKPRLPDNVVKRAMEILKRRAEGKEDEE